MIRELQHGTFGYPKGSEQYFNDKVIVSIQVTGHGGKKHSKITLENKTIGIFNGPYSTFVKEWIEK